MTTAKHHPWAWHIYSLTEKSGIVVVLVFCTLIFIYNVANVALWPFAAHSDAVNQYAGVQLLGWLETRCDEHWLGYNASFQGPRGRQHARVCLTKTGWVLIPTEDP